MTEISAVIFDLDGVIVSTDEQHYQAWKTIAEQEGIEFNRDINESLRGVSRMDSLDIILRKSRKTYSDQGKNSLAAKKNDIYKNLLKKISPQDILDGVKTWMDYLKEMGIKTAIGSSSKNTQLILERIGLQNSFDAIADGNEITKSKPDPEVFLLAAKKLGVRSEECLVIEDAYAGIDAAFAAGMRSLGVGSASQYEKATYRFNGLESIDPALIIKT